MSSEGFHDTRRVDFEREQMERADSEDQEVFTKTQITLTVLSHKSIPHWMDIARIIEWCDTEGFVLDSSADRKEEKISRDEMAAALVAAGSEPGFMEAMD